MLRSGKIQTDGPSKSEEATRAQDDQLEKEDPREVILPVPDEEYGLSSDEKQTFRSLNEALQEQSEPAAKPLIQKVTNVLRNKTDFLQYYVPIAIAIGPLHHDDPNLRLGEKFKLRLAALFIQNSGSTKRAFYDKIKADIENLKKCYDPEEITKYDDEKLAQMLFVDGCTVLCLLQYLNGVPAERKEPKIKSDMLAFMQHDLILLENQLPYRLIQTLISTASENHGDELKESIKNFIDRNILAPAEKEEKEEKEEILQQQMQQKQEDQQQQKDPAHLLELLRDRLLVAPEVSIDSLLSNYRHKSPQQQMQQKQGEQQQQQKQEDHQQQKDPAHVLLLGSPRPLVEPARNGHCMGKVWRSIGSLLSNCGHKSPNLYTFRNIKELKEKGVWLRPSETKSLKDVSFHLSIFTCLRGILKLPPIMVDDSTGPKLMNLTAYEMCPDFDNKFEISSYICFLDSLIDQPEDVKELRHSDILFNCLGSDEEVAILFNKMSNNLVPNPNLYLEVQSSIQNHCKNPLATFAAQTYHTHFSTPWTFLAFVGAIVALALSAIQTYYTIQPTSLEKNN